jgi:hypothetical protein
VTTSMEHVSGIARPKVNTLVKAYKLRHKVEQSSIEPRGSRIQDQR